MKFFLVFVIAIMSLMTGCAKSVERHLWDNMAEIRESVVFGRSDEMYVTIMSGEREGEYKLNGYATSLIPFGIITVDILQENTKDIEGDMSYVLFVGTKKYSGVFEINPYNDTFVADIGEKIDITQNIRLDIKYNGREESLKLISPQSEWEIDHEKCLANFVDKYKEELKKFVINEVFEGECYIKIIDDWDEFGSEYYYYVSVIGRSGSSISVVISPKSGEILASNCNVL